MLREDKKMKEEIDVSQRLKILGDCAEDDDLIMTKRNIKNIDGSKIIRIVSPNENNLFVTRQKQEKIRHFNLLLE